MFNFNTQLLIQAFGLIFMSLGTAARLGYWKKWFWQVRGSIYGYIPLGGLFILYTYDEALIKLFMPYPWITWIIYGMLLFLGIWFTARPPTFMKPLWIRWIEKYPDNIVEAMRNDAKDNPEWENHIKTEAMVDLWAISLKTGKGRKPKNNTAKG